MAEAKLLLIQIAQETCATHFIAAKVAAAADHVLVCPAMPVICGALPGGWAAGAHRAAPNQQQDDIIAQCLLEHLASPQSMQASSTKQP